MLRGIISLAMNYVFELRSYGVTLSNMSVSDPCLEVFGLSGALVLSILAIQRSYIDLWYFFEVLEQD